MPQEKSSGFSNSIYSEYIQTRDQYHQNIEIMVTSGEYRKAFELFWETITHSIKSLASVSGFPIHNDGFSRYHIQQVFERINDNEYLQLFLYLEKIYQQYYNKEWDVIDFSIILERANTFLERTDYLIEKINKK
jgi:hypothetical protein